MWEKFCSDFELPNWCRRIYQFMPEKVYFIASKDCSTTKADRCNLIFIYSKTTQNGIEYYSLNVEYYSSNDRYGGAEYLVKQPEKINAFLFDFLSQDAKEIDIDKHFKKKFLIKKVGL